MDRNDELHSSRLVLTRSTDVGLLIELGRQERSEIKRLKKSDGPLAQYIQSTVDEQRDQLGISSAVEVVPIVFLYRARETAEDPEAEKASE